MKEQNDNTNVVKKVGKLEQLSEEKQRWIGDLALNANQVDILESLKEHGIEVSAPTLSRFIKKHRAKLATEDGQALKESAADLAAQGKEGTLREGSLEAVRQRLFERALSSDDPEEARELFAAMQKEDAKVKELELEARKVAVAEQQVRLQAQKLAMEARRKGGAGTVVETATVEAIEKHAGKMPAVRAVSDRERLLLELIRDVTGILNRGGESPEGRLLEARMRLGAEVKLLEGEPWGMTNSRCTNDEKE
jgi:hypothetical protein